MIINRVQGAVFTDIAYKPGGHLPPDKTAIHCLHHGDPLPKIEVMWIQTLEMVELMPMMVMAMIMIQLVMMAQPMAPQSEQTYMPLYHLQMDERASKQNANGRVLMVVRQSHMDLQVCVAMKMEG